MALNLIRNSRVLFTTNLDSDNNVAATGFDDTNTFELQVQDGFSFSQNTGTETITLNEAGIAPIRGQRSFNTSLDPVDWSFATYIRPKFEAGSAGNTDDSVYAEEAVLWNALSGTDNIGDTNAGWVATTGSSPFSTVGFAHSNAHQLKSFGLIIVFEAVTYVIDNCAVDSATIDFGLDAIASVSWAGKGTVMRQLTTSLDLTTAPGTFTTGSLSGTYKVKDTTAKYIANKLSTMSVSAAAYGGINSGSFNVALTGGSISINNNLTYLTPANLGVVNRPITYFTGTRAITSSVTAYLKSGGSNDTAALLKSILNAATTNVDNKFSITVDLGGSGNANRVSLAMPTAMLTIPTIASEQVISTTITINPQAVDGSVYDVASTNELLVKYYAAA